MPRRRRDPSHDAPPFPVFPKSTRHPDAAAALAKTDGMVFAGGHEGLFDLGTAVAEVRLAADGSLRLRTGAPAPASPLAALRATSRLPGNVRFVRERQGYALVADTLIDGAAHLPRTFQWLRRGLLQGLQGLPSGPEPAPPETATPDKASVQQALRKIPWAGDGVVEQAQLWELRPRLRGHAVAVQLRIVPGGVRLSRVVLLPLPAADSPALQAVTDQAVRFNEQLRHARLAADEQCLVAEVRLHAGLIEPGWLATSAYAVAVAARHAETMLRILADQPPVAETYLAVFCSTGEQPMAPDVGV